MTRRRAISGLWLLSAALISGIDTSAADEPKPRALIALYESSSFSLPPGPLPLGLSFVLYDDGQILTRSNPTQADPDPPGRGVVFGTLDRDAAESLRRDAAADLKTAAAISGDTTVADTGLTVLEVWDGQRYRRFSASSTPCQAEGRTVANELWRRIREQTDPQFLKVCDRLMQFKIPAPRPWQPKTAQLVIGALDDPAERQVEWPKDWPPPPSGLKPRAGDYMCVPVSANPSDFSHSLITGRWGDIGRTALVIDANVSAVIWDWYFDLPAEIPMVNTEGELDPPPVGNSCAEVARP